MNGDAPQSDGAIAITGATGFIGRALLDQLEKTGRPLRCLVRNPAKLDRGGVEIVQGDLANADALTQLVGGADIVLHCAAALGGVSPDHLHDANVIGTARLARAAEKAGVRDFILASSFTAREPGLSAYAASKRAAEHAAMRSAGRMNVVSLRLPAIYGPGDPNTAPLIRAMRAGILPEPDRDARFSLLYVDDAAAALAAAVNTGGLDGVFEISDNSADCTWRSLAGAAEKASGRRIRLIPVPRAAADLAAVVSGAAMRITGGQTIFTREKVRELFHADWTGRDDAYTRITGWRAQTPLEDGLTRTLESL